MNERHTDGSAGDANYGVIGQGYTNYRQPDPHIADFIRKSLGDAKTVLNVGAGAGSYEPVDRVVTAVEPSASMRAQRPAHLPVAIDAVAEKLPFLDKSFDAGMATFTVHQWPDLPAGLSEMRRVTRGPVVILTCDPEALARCWLNDYAPEMISVEARRYPSMAAISNALGGEVAVLPVPIRCNAAMALARPITVVQSVSWSRAPGLQTRPGASSMKVLPRGSFPSSNGIWRMGRGIGDTGSCANNPSSRAR